MRCPHCNCDLAKEETIIAIHSGLACNKCAIEIYTYEELYDLSELVVPSDIGIGYTCKACGEESTAEQWNESTLELCTNRQERRKYVPIEKATKEKWYKCPSCGKRHKHKGVK